MTEQRLKDYYDNVFYIPKETEANADIKIDINKFDINILYKYIENLENNEKEKIINNIDCILSFNNNKYSGVGKALATLLNKEFILIDEITGLNNFYHKFRFNYKCNYLLWIDSLEYNKNIFNGIISLKKRGLKINNIISFFDHQEFMKEVILELFPNMNFNSYVTLKMIIANYEKNNLIDQYLSEKIMFNNDLKINKTKKLLNNYLLLKNKEYEHQKEPLAYYVNNYLHIHSDLKINFKKLILYYITEYNWTTVKNEIINYANLLNFIVIDESKILDLNHVELYDLQTEYNFKVFQHNPYRFNFNSIKNYMLNNNYYDYPETKYDGLILNISNYNLQSEEEIKSIKKYLSYISYNIFLNIEFTSNNNISGNISELIDIIDYSNNFANSKIQGLIFNYNNISNLDFLTLKKYNIEYLIPLILLTNDVNKNVTDFYLNYKFSHMMLSTSNYVVGDLLTNFFNDHSSNLFNSNDVKTFIKSLESKKKNLIYNLLKNKKYLLASYISNNNLKTYAEPMTEDKNVYEILINEISCGDIFKDYYQSIINKFT